MIVICEECGKKYRIDPDKIKGTMAKFKCRSCSHIITAVKPEEKAVEPPPSPVETGADDQREAPATAPAEKEAVKTDAPEEDTVSRKRPKRDRKKEVPRSKGIGLRFRMFLLFFLIPMICLGAAGFLLMQQTDGMINLMMSESSDAVASMAEDKVVDIARAVSKQAALYLNGNPDLQKEDFNYDRVFKRVAVQKLGRTGHTSIYRIPGSDGKWRTWAHADAKMVGTDMAGLKKRQGQDFSGFWKILTAVQKGKESRGYYRWREAKGQVREKYMVCTPIQGTPYVIAATTNIGEFMEPMTAMENRMAREIEATRNFAFIIFGTAVLLIAVIVSIYGHRLTGRIRALTDAANRISVGELEMEIEVKSGDEIGELADAISRMQESIRLSIERLRRRR